MMIAKLKIPRQSAQIAVLVFMLLLLIVGAIPGYFKGTWSWSDLPPVKTISQLKSVRADGLNLSSWKTLDHQILNIRNHDWLIQTVEKENQTAILLILTQDYYKDHPQVEWMDLNGFQAWKTDDRRHQTVEVDSTAQTAPIVKIKTRFFRSLTPDTNNLLTLLWSSCSSDQLCSLYQQQRLRQTYAVMQWYAWPDGGSPAPRDWFFADRMAQLSGRRAPWAAVNVLIPIEPLGNIETVEAAATSLAQDIQDALMQEALVYK
ncbi:MAG: cyanoexosortase B system-associated protein [Microcoleaceae cyanobacterium]